VPELSYEITINLTVMANMLPMTLKCSSLDIHGYKWNDVNVMARDCHYDGDTENKVCEDLLETGQSS
jgi:hypothetical protein